MQLRGLMSPEDLISHTVKDCRGNKLKLHSGKINLLILGAECQKIVWNELLLLFKKQTCSLGYSIVDSLIASVKSFVLSVS